MKNKSLRRVFIGIILPSIVAILLFFLSVWLFIIPIVEKNMMDNKKEMIGELTNTAWSLIDEFYQDYTDSIYSKAEAQKLAASKIELMRYGKDGKDYFWISDMSPKMIMHPYRKDLNGKSLVDYEDPNGFKLFVEAASIAKESGEGYLDYYWQLREDTSHIVQKISYVKAFPEWNWIVGTGIYIEDVRQDISALKNQIINISLVITGIIALILLFIIRQSFRIEAKRTQAEAGLKSSREKFKSLVEASTEGTLLLVDNQVIYANQTFALFSGYHTEQLLRLRFDDLFDMSWESMLKRIEEPGKSVTLEGYLKDHNGNPKEMVISLSKTYAQNETRVIVTTRELGIQQRLKIAEQQLSKDIENALIMMNQPINQYVETIVSCEADLPISAAAQKMTRHKKAFILVKQNQRYIGFVNHADICERAISDGISLVEPITEIMTAPIPFITQDALMPELLNTFKTKDTNYLCLKNAQNKITGVIAKTAIINPHGNAISVLLQEIQISHTENDIKAIFLKVPAMIRGMISGGVKPENLTRLISSVVDQIAYRAMEIALDELGEAPCDFAFIALGSEARAEQSLLTDQDNAIVFDDKFAENQDAITYFMELGNRVNHLMSSAGIHLCDGEIMANNPKWNKPLSDWKAYFTKWINKSDPESLLDASIFFDIKAIYGKYEFVAELQNHILSEVKNKAVFFQHMAQIIIQIKMPSLTANEINIKKIMLPLTGFARIYSLRCPEYETNTVSRLKLAAKHKQITPAAEKDLLQVYDFLMRKRIELQADLILQGEKPTNEMQTDELSEFEISTLKKAMSMLADYQTQLSADFKGMV
jgi:signal-transduction protein with cAMP-binding, CBS, and nucleotidyltransferase domain